MFNKNLLIVVLAVFLTVTCTATKHTTYWIRGYKKPCDGMVLMECLEVYQGTNLKKAQWEYIYGSIEGFEFEPGYLKKVILKKEHLDPKEVPADASSIRYTLIKELKKKKDSLSPLQGDWRLTHIRKKEVSENPKSVTIHFNISQNNVYGNDSCNSFFGSIKQITSNKMHFGALASTKRWCKDMSLATPFLQAIENVFFYRLDENSLFLLDENKSILMQFKRDQRKKLRTLS
jgi:heat shock protein HslJ